MQMQKFISIAYKFVLHRVLFLERGEGELKRDFARRKLGTEGGRFPKAHCNCKYLHFWAARVRLSPLDMRQGYGDR